MPPAARRPAAGEIVIAAAARGLVEPLGPDHYARLAAVARLIQVLAAGRPIAKAHPLDGK